MFIISERWENILDQLPQKSQAREDRGLYHLIKFLPQALNDPFLKSRNIRLRDAE
jgi:hypothetical protein